MIAEIPDLFGPGFTAQMTYYETEPARRSSPRARSRSPARRSSPASRGCSRTSGRGSRGPERSGACGLSPELAACDRAMSAPTDPVCVIPWIVSPRDARSPRCSHRSWRLLRPRALPLGSHDGVEELEGRVPTDIELRPSVEAAFPRESYAPRSTARLVVHNRARGLTLQLFRVGAERVRTADNNTMRGIAVTRPRGVGSSTGTRTIRVSIGDWPSGLYFARLRAADGRVGFAPFVVRPRRLGEQRVAIVMPTLTWQAYNLRDEDGDGVGDSWYASWSHRTVRLGRPFLNRGVPYAFRRYDLPFLRWLARRDGRWTCSPSPTSRRRVRPSSIARTT